MTHLDDLKAAGEAPQWMNEEGLKTLQGGYLQEGETPLKMYQRVARAAGSYYGAEAPKWESKFFEVMWRNWLGVASPILSNMGTSRGFPISCNSISPADSIESIFDKVSELAILSKNGAGVGIYLGDVRGRGAPIKGNGKSEGIIPWAKIFDATTHSVSQGSTRRGASAIYLPIEHLDIEEFLQIRRHTGDVNRRCHNINHGVCITDEWMRSMLGGDQKKRELWMEILKTRVETGEPYLFFSDTVNRANPRCYTDKGLEVKTSNICCLSADTEVVTSEGPRTISSLVGKSVTIWDGQSWVENNSFSLRGEDKLLRIHLKDGTHVDCNRRHNWYVTNIIRSPSDDVTTIMPAYLVDVGDRIEGHNVGVVSSVEAEVVRVEELEGVHPVYCPTVPSTGKFALSNGLMTGNSEITLHTDSQHTFVCCLSSLNLTTWEEWKDTDTVETTVRFLDAVLEEYIQKTDGFRGMEASRRSAIKGRAIGIGALGWHTLLQQRSIPFDSFDAMQLNAEIFRTIRTKAEEETARMAAEMGEPEWCKGYGRRHTHLMAIAPTVSNSTISGGHSAGIEPITANYYNQPSAKGTFIRKNPTLVSLLEEKGMNTLEVWSSINEKQGSVQHLKFLSDHEKEVFRTAREINQHALVKQAAQRQKWVDQAQSLNLFFASNSDPRYVHAVHIAAWEEGVKTLYYCRASGVIRGDLASRSKEECLACEG